MWFIENSISFKYNFALLRKKWFYIFAIILQLIMTSIRSKEFLEVENFELVTIPKKIRLAMEKNSPTHV